MTEYLTEQEQIQYLKSLARQYIPAVMIGLLLAFLLSVSWHAWQNHQNLIRVQASMIYETMLKAQNENKTEAAKKANILLNQYPKTVYANLAAFLLAKQAATEGRLNEAQGYLQTAFKNSSKTGLKNIARIRLARIKIADNDPTAALALLDPAKEPAYAGLINAIRGDAFLKEGNVAAAATAYRLALQQLPKASLLKSLLQMKYTQLPASVSAKNIQE